MKINVLDALFWPVSALRGRATEVGGFECQSAEKNKSRIHSC